MKTIGKRLVILLVAVSMAATLGLAGCSSNGGGNDISNAVAQLLEGDVTGQIGKEYKTQWFTFTINSMSTNSSFAGYTAASGNKLVIANITLTNIFGSSQPFGTYDWFVLGDNTDEIYPLSPLNDKMMPESFSLNDKETVTYDVVIEFPEDLKNPYFMYTEIDEKGTAGTTFKIPIK